MAILTTPTWKQAAVVTVAWGLAGGVLLWTTAFNLLMRKPDNGPIGAMIAGYLVGMVAAVGWGSPPSSTRYRCGNGDLTLE